MHEKEISMPPLAYVDITTSWSIC